MMYANIREDALLLRLRGWMEDATAIPPRERTNRAFVRVVLHNGSELERVGNARRCSFAQVPRASSNGDASLCVAESVHNTSVQKGGWDLDHDMWEFRMNGMGVVTLCYHCAQVIRKAKESGALTAQEMQGMALVSVREESEAWGHGTPSRKSFARRSLHRGVHHISLLTNGEVYAWMQRRNAQERQENRAEDLRAAAK